MGLDWIAYLPETSRETLAKRTTPNTDSNDMQKMYRAGNLRETPIPEVAKTKAWNDMSSHEMENYAAELEHELKCVEETNDIDKDQRVIIMTAIEWLQYWADKGAHIEAWY